MWDSRNKKSHYIKANWPERHLNPSEKKNVVYEPLLKECSSFTQSYKARISKKHCKAFKAFKYFVICQIYFCDSIGFHGHTSGILTC